MRCSPMAITNRVQCNKFHDDFNLPVGSGNFSLPPFLASRSLFCTRDAEDGGFEGALRATAGGGGVCGGFSSDSSSSCKKNLRKPHGKQEIL